MNTALSQPIYQESLAINRVIQNITRGYNSNGNFNLAFKIKDDMIAVCNDLDLGVSSRFKHTFKSYYIQASDGLTKLLEHMEIANKAHMLRGMDFQISNSFVSDYLHKKMELMLEIIQSDVPVDFLTLSAWARQKLALS
jgi:hypothetical protein